MRDVELYRALLGLTAPWTVGRRGRGPEGEARGGAGRRGARAVPVPGVRGPGAGV
jgi:hypothetical protein